MSHLPASSHSTMVPQSISPATLASSFPKFISESRILEPRALPIQLNKSPATAATTITSTSGANMSANVAVSSSSGNGGSRKSSSSSPPPLNLCIVINICHYITPLAKLIIQAQPLESTACEEDREAFCAFQSILKQLDAGKNEPINIFPFLDKICHFMDKKSLDGFEELDISFVWDSVVKLITKVISPLNALFLGHRPPSDEGVISRCIHAQFSYPVQTLEDFIKVTLNQQDGYYVNQSDTPPRHRTALESIKSFNAMILSRLPDILAFAVESGHLPPSLRFLEVLSKNHAKPPISIKYPSSFSLPKDHLTISEAKDEEEEVVYDLVSVVTLEGTNFDVAQAYYRFAHELNHLQWYKGAGAAHDLVDQTRAIEKNYLHVTDTKKIHPRLLIYAKRGIDKVAEGLQDFVTKGGQLRSLGDATFEVAETPEQFDEAKQYYEDAIACDEKLRSVLSEKLEALEQIERNQKAQSYENQADQSLGKKRFKEACDLYKLAIRSVVPNSSIHSRIREKEDYMMRIISLEIANHLTEKGEECLKSGMYTQSREHFAQALKLNPNYIHLQSIIAGIDKVITAQTSAQKVSEANMAMKLGRYKHANQLFKEAIALVPEREISLKAVLESLVVLMQGEDALMKQRNGLLALEDKKYNLAIQLITEAISLLPPESITEHAFFLCDRAQVYFEMKDYKTSIDDCHAALELRPELAIAFFRLGSAQFELDQLDEALQCYEKALRYDPSLADQVKVKVRQVHTAKEIQQRKEREAERARIKEEERKRIEEKRQREEKLRKERQERQIQEQYEKAERQLMQKEDKLMQTLLNRNATSAVDPKNKSKDAAVNKEKLKKEKAERESQRAAEKDRIRQEKEKERERVKAEKEAKLREEQEVKEQELQRQREFAAEMEKAAAKLRDAEREKELERERVRMENERIIAEREKARQEKEKDNKRLPKKECAENPPITTKAKGKKAAQPLTVDFPTLSYQAGLSSSSSKVNSSYVSSEAKQVNIASKASVAAKPAVIRSVSTPVVAATKWASLLVSEEPVLPNPAKTISSTPVKSTNTGFVEDFPPLSDNSLPPAPVALTGPTVAAIVAQGVQSVVSNPTSSHSVANQSGGVVTAQASTATSISPLTSVAPSPALPPEDTSATPLPRIPSSGDVKAKQSPIQQEMPSLGMAYPSPNAFSDYTTSSPGVWDSLALPPPGIRPVSPRQETSNGTKDEVLGSSNSFYNLSATSSLGVLAGSATDAAGGTGSDLRGLLGLSRASSSTLDSGLGLNTPLDLAEPPGGLGRVPSLNNMNSLGLGLGLGLGLDSIDSGSSRLSYLFGGNNISSTINNSNISNSSGHGSSLENGSATGSGAGNVIDNNLNFALPVFSGLSSMTTTSTVGLSDSSNPLGLNFLDGGLSGSGRDAGQGLFSNRPSGLFEDTQGVSRLDKILGLNSSSNNGGLEAFSTPSLGGLQDGTSSSSLLSGLGPFWGQDSISPSPTSSALFGGGSSGFNLSSLLSAPAAPRRMDLVDLNKRVEEELLSDASFPSVSWLRALGMVMFRWATVGADWVEFGMALPRNVAQAAGDLNSLFADISRRSGCEIKLTDISLNGETEKAAIFVRGPVGSRENRLMDQALELLNATFSKLPAIQQLQTPPQSASTPSASASRWASPPLSVFDAQADSMVEALVSSSAVPAAMLEAVKSVPPTASSTASVKIADRPPLLKIPAHPSGQVRRCLEIPADLIGLVIGAGGKKIKELGTESACKVQFKTSKASEKEGKPGVLELQGSAEHVDKAMQMVWELVQSVGREYKEITIAQSRKLVS
eukprot:scaffold2066_cov229-Ochromonas_danica.AAC.2